MATILNQTMKKAFLPTVIALFISACTSLNPITESIKDEAYSSSEFYLNKAEQAKEKEDKISYQLLAVRKLIDENKEYEAQNTFSEIMASEMNEVQKLEYALVYAQLAALQGKNEMAVNQLRDIPQSLLSSAQRVRYIQTQARIAANKNDAIGVVRARSQLNDYFRMNRERQENNDIIWRVLRDANRGMLEKAVAEAGEIEFAGWLALINIYNQNMTTPTQIPQAFNNWKNQYPSHSAVTLMPTELQGVSNFQQTQLNGVALLLPLSGDAQILGDIIKRGFDDAKAGDSTAVQTFDTSTSDVNSLIARAKQQGANIIVGPLLKSRVDEMLLSHEIQHINVLALNSTENARNMAQVCYYGLSPESEAQAGAEKMYNDGHSIAVVAAPQDDFGHRSAEAFAKRWRQLTNTDADVRYYNQPLDSVATIQNTGVTKAGLYILGNAGQVVEIKQGIDNSNLKDRLAMYTSSRSNSPNNGIDFYTIMEGVKFSEVPLLADTSSSKFQKAENLANSDFSMMRLYAMGADAWLLATKFNELRHIPGYKISGLTGELKAGQNCNIERSLSWMQYQNGAIQQAY
ncbi:MULTISPECIES: penicillin-binding protein activator [Mannheimia]|uniref:Penicillin-binding protein activator n=1 Tax=Mannheimia pernigra TaxID=111844 RepID=A0ABD7A5V6_9PAST|nr:MULTISPECIES: penicillin-binding protein activator [Mannheimia]QLB41379.1 penicillin-binding protein activator [Mannheimia pernigra]QTM01380.1 penicillin-binding protein activator [Mannheimia sp. ZY171111]